MSKEQIQVEGYIESDDSEPLDQNVIETKLLDQIIDFLYELETDYERMEHNGFTDEENPDRWRDLIELINALEEINGE